MNRLFRWVAGLVLIVGLLIAFVVLLGRRSSAPVALQGEGTATPMSLGPTASPPDAYPPPTVPPTIAPDAYPPPPTIAPSPSPFPTPTTPPVPTIPPTPMITPIPVAQPPFIPSIIEKTPQPFWIYYWQDNEIWRVDDHGEDREILLDTVDRIGQWLTAHPMEGTDCCPAGPRVTVSPNGEQLALVVVDTLEGSKGEGFTFSIYVYDVRTDELQLVSEGTHPEWSPDGQRIAFRREGGLWIANVETGDVRSRTVPREQQDVSVSEIAWSPDGTQIAYTYDHGMQRLAEIWLVTVDNEKSPKELVNQEYSIYGLTWSADSRRIFYLSHEGSIGASQFHRVRDLWSVLLETGSRVPLTDRMVILNYSVSPQDGWLVLNGYQKYVPNPEYDYDLWLLRVDSEDMRRLPDIQNSLEALWSPDGTRLLVRRTEEAVPIMLSLGDATRTTVDFELGSDFQVGGLK